jgi:hypothetical protein
MYNLQQDYSAGFCGYVQFTARLFMLLDTITFFTLLLIHGNLVNFLFTNVNDDDILHLIL